MIVELYTDHLGSTSGQTDASGNGVNGSYTRFYAYGSLRIGDPTTLSTDRTFTGQKADGTGLLYYNARYYDPALGTFLSPDTLVPDAGRVIDYNRFLYVRGNPLKYTDPTGHYTNNEIMQHYGCEDWACVEALYQRGSGSNVEGLWGWLYMLQLAEDGYAVTGGQIGSNHRVSGTFQRAANGKIEVLRNGNILPDWVMARMGADSPSMGHTGWYGLDTGGYKAAFTWSSTKHNYLYVDPSKIDKKGLALGVLSAGSDVGPVAVTAGAAHGNLPLVVAGGIYWVVGEGFSLYTDIVEPITAYALQGDLTPGAEVAATELLQFGAGRLAPSLAPYVGPAWDIGSAIYPGLCYGTGCPR